MSRARNPSRPSRPSWCPPPRAWARASSPASPRPWPRAVGAIFWMWLMALIGAASALHRVHLALITGSRQGRRVPRRSGLLHSAGPGPALARHHLRLGAHPVLRLRLQRPAGVQHDFGARVLHPTTYQRRRSAWASCSSCSPLSSFSAARSASPSSASIIVPIMAIALHSHCAVFDRQTSRRAAGRSPAPSSSRL